MSEPTEVYQLKITLKHINPPIWRRLLIPSTASFWNLHVAIQDSFGWADYHLHEFFIGPEAWDRSVPRIRIPHPEDDVFKDEREPYDEAITSLSQFLTPTQPKATYVYDFGDGWEHRILLEQIVPYDPKEPYPQVVKGKRAGPWEDSGGPWGYQEKLEILSDPTHEEHQEILEWLGVDDPKDLDGDHFDLDQVIFRNPATELRKLQRAIRQEGGQS